MLYNLFENRDFVSVFAVALLAEGVDRNTKDYRTEWTCKECGAKFSLENTALFEYDCSCGRHTYGQTNIESPDFSYPCGDCGKETTLKWNPKAKKYME